MKKIGALMLILTLIILIFIPIPMQIKYTLGGFGIVGGIVLIGISGYTNLDP